jgi:transposase
MPKKKYIVTLTEPEKHELHALTHKGTASVRKVKRALILLKADAGQSDPQIMAAVEVSRPCVERLRQRYVEGGIERALSDRPRPGAKRKLDGRCEAQLIATACSAAPAGHDHWTLRLLAGHLVELGLVEQVSHETVRQCLKKTP